MASHDVHQFRRKAVLRRKAKAVRRFERIREREQFDELSYREEQIEALVRINICTEKEQGISHGRN